MMGTLKASIVVACILFCADLTTAANWYKGAIHVHNSDSDADASSSLLEMVQIYRDVLGYNFVFSTPHHPGLTTELNNGTDASLLTATGRFDTATFKAWDGEEVTTDIFQNGAWRGRHFGALGKTSIDPVLHSTSKRIPSMFRTIQDIIDHINTYPDPLLTIINHPSWGQLGAAEILADAQGVNHLEVLNDYVSNGEQDIDIWDEVLSRGRQMYPIGSDDAHSTNHAGQAWTVVWANDLSMHSVLDAMDQGKLYASNGPVVTFYSVNDVQMVVEAVKGTVTPPCCRGRRHTDPITEIRFVGEHGTILKTVPITSGIARAEYNMQGTELYVRAEVHTGQVANKHGLPELALLPAYFPAQSHPFTLGAEDADDVTPTACPFANLARCATATASSVWSSSFAAARANDGNGGTRWNSASGNAAGAWLALDFGAPTTFDTIVLTEAISRITGYTLQYWDGTAWRTIVTGTTMGTKTHTFASLTAAQLRLLITGVTGGGASVTPTLYEFEVYKNSVTPPTNQPPTANAGPDQTVLEGDTVTFDGTASRDPEGTPLLYQWDLGDGTPATGAVVTHVYDTPGFYTATLTVSDGTLSASDTTVVAVDAACPFANLARCATATASSVWSSSFAAARANDGNGGTRWNSASGNAAGAWLALDFGAPTTFDTIVLTEAISRITGYTLQYWDGTAWRTIVTGTTMGTKTHTFASRTAAQLRLLITGVTGGGASVTPTLYEFEVYGQ